MIDLPVEAQREVLAIIRRRLPAAEIRVFGSRVQGRARPFSDLDIALVDSSPIPPYTLGRLKEDFEESTLPFRVDLLDWQAISPEFRAVIAAGYEVLAGE
jgi:predicted nucleotidyltransferase